MTNFGSLQNSVKQLRQAREDAERNGDRVLFKWDKRDPSG